ncbi:MAG: hypothetical protein EOO60_05910 [Hymenobacter sp.]|nr:MAG: hypothetical protein EOO60_05910 [Hymenobacter sp.]
MLSFQLTRSVTQAVGRYGLSLAFAVGITSVAQAQTTTPFACRAGQSFIFQGTATYAIQINTATGQQVGSNSNAVIASSSGNQRLNAVGYNQKDNYIWGLQYGTTNSVNNLVQVGGDFNSNLYTVSGLSGDAVNCVIGDVSANGIMYITRGGSTGGGATNNNTNALTIYSIDLTAPAGTNPSSYTARPFATLPVYSASNPVFINDWAISPVDGHLYSIYATIAGGSSTNPAALTIFRILTKAVTVGSSTLPAGTLQTIGRAVADNATGATNAITASNYASSFMDASGNYYVISSDNGYTYRINTPNTAPFDGTQTNFTGYYLGTGPTGGQANVDGARCAAAAPLPVTLVSFDATAAPNRSVQLAWTTASEQNNDYFEVQHSLDGRMFAAIGKVVGHQTTAQASTYFFTAPNPGVEAVHYYRLRQVDLDGTSTFSPVRAVSLAAGSSLVQLTVAPNPTTPDNLRVRVQYAGTEAAPATLTVQSLLGRTLLTQPVSVQPGANVLIPTLKLAPGAYWLSLNGAALGQQGVRVLVGN